jgi:uncharacterized protein (UPF0548 family)
MRRPTSDELVALLARCGDDRLTYEPAGASLGGIVVHELRAHHWATDLRGRDAFDRGVEAIRTWAVHRGSGLDVAADGPIAVGTNVALCAPLPVGFVDATCRIVAVIDEPDRHGFAYGTLSVHPERGEEAFVVTRERGAVRFEVHAASRPAHPLARVLPFVADRLQDAAVRRYLAAMTTITGP